MSQKLGATACADCPRAGGCDHAGDDHRDGCCQSAGLRRAANLWRRPAVRQRLALATATLIAALTAAALIAGSPGGAAWPAWGVATTLALWWSAPQARPASPWGQALAAATLLVAASTPAWPLAVAAIGFVLRLDRLHDRHGIAGEMKLAAAVAIAAIGATIAHTAPLAPALGAALAAALGLLAGERATARRQHQALLADLAEAQARAWAASDASEAGD